MSKILCFTLAFVASSAAAQGVARPDPVNAKAVVPARPYESPFKDYRPYVDQEAGRWRESNDEMGRLGGHAGHSQTRSGSPAKPAAKPPAPGGHGGHK